MSTLSPESTDELRDDVAKALAYADGEGWYTASELLKARFRRRADAALAVLDSKPPPPAYKALADKVAELTDELAALKRSILALADELQQTCNVRAQWLTAHSGAAADAYEAAAKRVLALLPGLCTCPPPYTFKDDGSTCARCGLGLPDEAF